MNDARREAIESKKNTATLDRAVNPVTSVSVLEQAPLDNGRDGKHPSLDGVL